MRHKNIQLNPSILPIPQQAISWYLAVRELPATNTVGIFTYVLFEKDRGLVLDSQFAEQDFTPNQLLKVLESAILSPQDSLFGSPHRPMSVAFEQHEIWQALEPHLTAAGIAAVFDPQPGLLDAFLEEAWAIFDETQDLSMLQTLEVTPSLLAAFFTAASAFYRAAPWTMLDDSQPLTLQFLPEGRTWYAIILGQAKLQYGVLFFENWQDIQVFSSETSNPLDNIPENGIQAINFEDQENLLPADLQDIHTYGWELPAPNIYPYPVIYTKEDLFHPDGERLAHQTVAIQAIQRFVTEQLLSDQDGDFLPAQAEYSFSTDLGPIQIVISYPIKEIPEPKLVRLDPLSLDEPQALAAVQLAEQAWHTEQPSQRVSLAQQALELWSDCVQAHVILGEESDDAEEAYQHFQHGIQAAEKLIDADQLAASMGQMWQTPGLRFYLMAIQGFVECLIEMEDYQLAQQEAQRLLEYNQADHQGIRYTMLYLLFQQNRDVETSDLLQRYPEEPSASWPYSRALLAFKEQGNSLESQVLLQKALESNPHIPAYLTGKKLIPDELPEFDSFGDEIEAMHYARDYFFAWWQTKGAIDWLRRNLPTQASA